MASASLNSASTRFFGSEVPVDGIDHSRPMSVKFRPARISAACSSTAERTRGHVATSPSSSSLYEVLGIEMGATCQEIKAAYRRLARVLHPDVTVANDYENRGFEFMKVQEAYETLSDPEKRAAYNLSFYSRRRPTSSPSAMSGSPNKMASASGYRGRKWETDQCW